MPPRENSPQPITVALGRTGRENLNQLTTLRDLYKVVRGDENVGPFTVWLRGTGGKSLRTMRSGMARTLAGEAVESVSVESRMEHGGRKATRERFRAPDPRGDADKGIHGMVRSLAIQRGRLRLPEIHDRQFEAIESTLSHLKNEVDKRSTDAKDPPLHVEVLSGLNSVLAGTGIQMKRSDDELAPKHTNVPVRGEMSERADAFQRVLSKTRREPDHPATSVHSEYDQLPTFTEEEAVSEHGDGRSSARGRDEERAPTEEDDTASRTEEEGAE